MKTNPISPQTIFTDLRQRPFLGDPDQLQRYTGPESIERIRHELDATGDSHTQYVLWRILREHGLEPEPDEANQVIGIAAEIGMGLNSVLAVGFRSGAASLYTNTGGGMIGGETKPHVREAAIDLNRVAGQLAPTVPLADKAPSLPDDGHICFSLLTPGGLRVAAASEQALQNEAHPLHPLFVAMHQFLAALRLADPSTPSEPEPVEANDEQAYANCLLTTLAQNPGQIVVITVGQPLPDLAGLTDDWDQLAWIASYAFQYDQLNSEAVIQLLQELTDFGRLSFLQSRGVLQAALALDNGKLKPVAFRIQRRCGLLGTKQIQLTPTE